MLMMTLVCWLGFLFVIWTINPEETSWLGFSLFYLSLFLAIVGTASLIGFIIRFVGLKQNIAFRSVRDAFRQSFLLAFLITAILFLLSKNLFSWLNVFFLVIGLSIFEFFLVNYQRPYLSDNKINENEREKF